MKTTDHATEAVRRFTEECQSRRLRLKIWWGFSMAMGTYCVCYDGILSDCEEAENRIIRRLSKELNVGFCYVSPAPSWVEWPT
jgi:hypothetical protein